MRSRGAASEAAGYEIRRSRRAKRLRIVVDPHRVAVVAPTRARRREILRFVDTHRDWINSKRRELRSRYGTIVPKRVEEGAEVLLRGRRVRLTVRPGPVSSVRAGRILALRVAASSREDREATARHLLVTWLRAEAAADAERYVARHSPGLGRWPEAIRVKSQKTLWGSCGKNGTLHLNWRLIGAPAAVFEYVVVHELCHLERRDHSPAFWRRVASLLPDYREQRDWLRTNGLSLS